MGKKTEKQGGYAKINAKQAAGRDRLKRTAELLNGRGTAVESLEERNALKKLIDVVLGGAGIIMAPSSATVKDRAVTSLLFQTKEDE